MNSAEDIRLEGILQAPTEEAIAKADVVLFGVPTDEGILRNGGRPGASQAPHAIRTYLHKLTPLFQGKELLGDLAIVDMGNVGGKTLEEMHANARELTATLRHAKKTVIALGGGHDVTYPLATGFSDAHDGDFSLVNVDAHLDVRPKKNDLHHSGSSFRLLIEEGFLSGRYFIEFGIQSFAAAPEHYHWALEQEASVLWYETIADRIIPAFSDLAKNRIDYLSFDIDAIRSADAPGCSAPSPIGLSAYEACQIARLAAKSGTQMFDIVEVSPAYDVDGRTSKLAARMIAYFLAGMIERKSSI